MTIDLLRIKGLGALLKSSWFWLLVRLALLALLVAMIAYGWHHHQIPGVTATDPLMYTNLATYGLWVLWLMGVVLLALLFGRLWCAFCPLGWLNGVIARSGLQLRLPHWLQNFFPVTLVLIVLLLAVYLLAIHRFPDYTAVMLTIALGLVLLCGILFRQRAFCQLFCPAGAVLSLYARVAPFQLRVGEQAVCDSCESQRCVSGEPYWQRFSLGRGVLFWHTQRPACPVDLQPAQLNDAAGCTLCLQCVENCAEDNLRLGFRPWLAELGRRGLPAGETLFLLVLLGMVTASFSKVNVPQRELLFWLPEQVALLLGWQAPGYSLLAAIWVTLLLPLLLLMPGLLLFRLRHLTRTELPAEGAAKSLPGNLAEPPQVERLWPELGQLLLPFIPLVLTAHLLLAFVKLNAKVSYLPLVLQDPTGVQSYLAMQVTQTIMQPGSLLSLEILKWLALAILFAGFMLSLYSAHRIGRRLFYGQSGGYYFGASLLGLSLTAGLYLDTLIRWLFIR